MATSVFVDSAKLMAKGQVTIPKDVRNVLGVGSGDRITFVVEGQSVRVFNAATYAMLFEKEMLSESKQSAVSLET